MLAATIVIAYGHTRRVFIAATWTITPSLGGSGARHHDVKYDDNDCMTANVAMSMTVKMTMTSSTNTRTATTRTTHTHTMNVTATITMTMTVITPGDYDYNYSYD